MLCFEWNRDFVLGLGCVFEYYNNFDSEWPSHSDFELVYYKKGDEEWGEELVLVGVEEDILENDFKIFPNPVQGQLYISTHIASQNQFSIQVFNSTGQIVKSLSVSSRLLNIDMSVFSKGFYYVNLVDENGMASAKQKVLKI